MREDVHVPKHDQALSELLQGLQGEIQGEEGMTLFSLYEGKHIRLTDDQGNILTGVADTFPAEYGMHELGREEEGIQLGEYVIYRS